MHQQGHSLKIGGDNITLLNEWKNKDCSVLNIKRKIPKLISGNRWTNLFCRNEDDELVAYSQSNNQLFRALKANKIRYTSSVFNEESALRLIRETVSKNAFEIAKWLRGSDSSIGFLVTDSEPIGLVIHKENHVQNFSSCAVMSLRKADEPCKNRSGFFVDRIVPIPEVGDL